MAAVSKIEKGVIELRTDVGRLYVCPSGWQRLYLRWTFRNFHCLPREILNRRQKRMIEQLCGSAIVTPAERVPAALIIGIVENMRVLGLPSAADSGEVKTARPATHEAALAVLQGTAEEGGAEFPAPVMEEPARVVPEAHGSPEAPAIEPTEQAAPAEASAEAEHFIREAVRKRSLRTVPVALAGAAAAVLAAFWLVPLWRVQQLRIAPTPAPAAPSVALEVQPAPPAPSVAAHKPTDRLPLAGKTPAGAETRAIAGHHAIQAAAPGAASGTAASVPNVEQLPQIVEAPRSGFIYPVSPNPNLVGKVVLKAVVGSDGKVKQVAVLSGDRALAAAAVRAVRQWRYAPAEVGGHTVDAETHVTISFLGDDAVSIILPPQR